MTRKEYERLKPGDRIVFNDGLEADCITKDKHRVQMKDHVQGKTDPYWMDYRDIELSCDYFDNNWL